MVCKAPGHSPSIHLLDKLSPDMLSDLAGWFENLAQENLDAVWVSAVSSFLLEETDLKPGVLKQFVSALNVVRERYRSGNAFVSSTPVSKLQLNSRGTPFRQRGRKPLLTEQQARDLLAQRPKENLYIEAKKLCGNYHVDPHVLVDLWMGRTWPKLHTEAA